MSTQSEERVHRISANFSEEVAAILEDIAERRGITKTEVLRQALATEKFIDEERRKGSRILVEDPDSGEVQVVVFR